MDIQEAEKIVTEKSNEELLGMLELSNDWQPQMIGAATAELEKRGVEFKKAIPPPLAPRSKGEGATADSAESFLGVKQQPGQKAASPAGMISVTLPDGSTKEYRGEDIKGSLRTDIISGALPMNLATKKEVVANGKTVTTSGTLRQIAKSAFYLDSLYRPVWAHAIRGISCGAAVGIGLKLLDTAILIFSINQKVGVLMLMAIGGLFAKKAAPYVMGAIILVSVNSGVSMNLYMAIIGAGIVGALLGMLPGMAIGGLVGLVRAGSLPRAHDAIPERGLPVLTAVLLPGGCGAGLIYLYLFWLNPLIAKWLAK